MSKPIRGSSKVFPGLGLFEVAKYGVSMGVNPTYQLWTGKDDDIVFESYEPIGSGKFGVVSRAVKDGKTYVIKVLKRDDVPQDELCKEIHMTALLTKGLGASGKPKIPNIVTVEGYFVDDEGTVYMVMEDIKGGSLRSFLEKVQKNPADFPNFTIQEALRVASEIAKPFTYLTPLQSSQPTSFVHRDLFARNVLVDCDPTGKITQVKVADFGLFLEVGKEGYAHLKGQMNPPLPPPEAADKHRHYVQSDIWEFGVLLWEIFSLGTEITADIWTRNDYYLPLPRTSIMPPEVYDFIKKCHQSDISKRPQTWKEVIDNLNEIATKVAPWDISRGVTLGARD